MPRKTDPKRPATRRRRPKREAATVGLGAGELAASPPPPELEELARTVAADGGAVLARYRDPYGGRWLLLCALPIERVVATPYQRDLSDPHVRRLSLAIDKVGSFLDPIVAVRAGGDPERPYETPNGHHRLGAMRALGARTIVALLAPDPALAFQILALNTERAHNLRERSLEVVRMARGLAALGDDPESRWAFQLEEPDLLVLGFCYEARPRFSGSAYQPILRRSCAEFLEAPLSRALEIRAAQAKELLALDDEVTKAVQALQARGLESPYLRLFVVARLNPLRFSRGASADFGETMAKMRAAAAKFDAAAIRKEDLARTPPAHGDGE